MNIEVAPTPGFLNVTTVPTPLPVVVPIPTDSAGSKYSSSLSLNYLSVLAELTLMINFLGSPNKAVPVV